MDLPLQQEEEALNAAEHRTDVLVEEQVAAAYEHQTTQDIEPQGRDVEVLGTQGICQSKKRSRKEDKQKYFEEKRRKKQDDKRRKLEEKRRNKEKRKKLCKGENSPITRSPGVNMLTSAVAKLAKAAASKRNSTKPLTPRAGSLSPRSAEAYYSLTYASPGIPIENPSAARSPSVPVTPPSETPPIDVPAATLDEKKRKLRSFGIGFQSSHDDKKPPPSERSFGIVYSRKRAASGRDEEPKADGRFGVVFTRRHKRSNVAPSRQDTHTDLAAIPCSSSVEFAARTGFLDAHFVTLVDDAGAASFVILVDTSCPGSSHRFSHLLLPVLRWMRQSRRCQVRNLASFLCSMDVAVVFASRGLHFVKLQRRRDDCGSYGFLQSTPVHYGWCELHDAKESQPLLSLNFSALPAYFKSLHSVSALRSIYLPAMIRQGIRLAGGPGDMCPKDPKEMNSVALTTGDPEPALDLGGNGSDTVMQDYVPLEQVAGVVVHGLRLKKHQRKRSSMRHPLSRRRPAARFPLQDKAVGMKQGTVGSQTEMNMKQGTVGSQTEMNAKLPLTKQEVSVEPVQPKPALEISLDLLENMDDSDVSTPMGSNGKHNRSSFKSPVEQMNERLSEVRQNIYSHHCKANLLIIQADRGWREEGALVMLELLGSNEWRIAVKMHGVTRISLMPSEQRFYVVNRFTHAYIWAINDGWKLEFSEKWDWLLFKELHIKGRERNSQVKTIPIPGVLDVSDGMEGAVTEPFSRPVPDYIKMVDDEVERALLRDSVYDMDSDDERWLVKWNHADSDGKGSRLNHVSCEDFEKMITTFERDAYSNPDRANDVDELLSRHPALVKDDNVLAMFEYWTSKRDKKGAPLLRMFQGAPLRREQRSIRKKRSFKKQRSQAGRGKPGNFLPVGNFLLDNAEKEALQRVVDAERAAKQAVETAVRLRSRAQVLMANAELATYKSVMALRIAEAARISNLCHDLVSTTLD